MKILILVLIGFLVSCASPLAPAPVAPQVPATARDALKALGKLEAATQVGVSFNDYGPLLVDAKAQVNAAIAELPGGELQNEIGLAIDAFADANTVWQEKVKAAGNACTMSAAAEPGSTLASRYDLKTYTYTPGGPTHFECDPAMQAMWAAASAHFAKATALVTPKQ